MLVLMKNCWINITYGVVITLNFIKQMISVNIKYIY